jgi:hypothetical protein
MKIAIAAVLFAAMLGYTAAQWLSGGDEEFKRGPDGKLDLAAPPPRLNGKPNLSGLWQAERTPTSEYVRVLGPELPAIQPDLGDATKYMINVFWDEKPTELPLKPEAVALTEQRQRSGVDFQSAYCLPSSLPAAMLGIDLKIVQARDEIVILPGGDPARQIPVDGRTLPEHPEPSWMGTSAGHWEDDTLVVETTGFNERAWLDAFGHPRSEAMRLTERFRRRDVGHIDLDITIDDPTYYARPFGFKTTLNLLPDDRWLEYVCTENQKFGTIVPKK